MRVYLFIAAIAGGATFLLTPLIRHLAIQIGAVGKVRARDVHTIPTPRMGGLAMMLGFAVAMLFASHIPFVSGLFQNSHQAWWCWRERWRSACWAWPTTCGIWIGC